MVVDVVDVDGPGTAMAFPCATLDRGVGCVVLFPRDCAIRGSSLDTSAFPEWDPALVPVTGGRFLGSVVD